ncbi:hypothetical protein [[Mycobacterium] vasticus]|uniref:Uncharacterized protein n=1 Tax=[Mycobacterium] vasticus TaxID=2875777 RepID=A0ABU5YWI8_9MYCO|nr:hypothetical protein [Mycolicibacter sp. MYC017]MEB3069489.1 hypothetical protein [Mycolicibacter sp. MYC017]
MNQLQDGVSLSASDLSPRLFGELTIHEIADRQHVIADDGPQIELLDQSLDAAAPYQPGMRDPGSM